MVTGTMSGRTRSKSTLTTKAAKADHPGCKEVGSSFTGLMKNRTVEFGALKPAAAEGSEL